MASRPAIFIPLPTAADNHQFKNVQVLEKRGAAVLLNQKDLDGQKLGTVIEDLRSSREKLHKMASQLKDIDYSGAPTQILKTLMEDSL